jgi:hypothetical protein
MAAEKEAGLSRRKGSAGRDGSGRTVERASHDVAVADVDPWGSFFEKFWGPAEGEGADQPDDGREPAKSARKTGARPGKVGALPCLRRQGAARRGRHRICSEHRHWQRPNP